MSDHYERFFRLAVASTAHSAFCERVYGLDLCQDGQTDIACLKEVAGRLGLAPADHALDLGCGAGGLAAYLSDLSGARLTGIDKAAAAIDAANALWRDRGDRLAFRQADFNQLGALPETYDAVLTIDAVAWVKDMAGFIKSIANLLKPGGRLCIITEQRRREDDPPDILEPRHTPVARALSGLGLAHEIVDLSRSLSAFWERARRTAESLRDDFAREGTQYLYTTWMRAADTAYLPAIDRNLIRRYMYIARV